MGVTEGDIGSLDFGTAGSPRLQERIEFNEGDVGLAGGIQADANPVAGV